MFGTDCVCVCISNLYIYNFYFSPDSGRLTYFNFVDDKMESDQY